MHFEVILKIFISLFATFGIYCLICITLQTLIRSDKVRVAVVIDSERELEDLDIYIEDASSLCFLRNTAKPIVMIRKDLRIDEASLLLLESRGVRCVFFEGKES